MKLDPEQANKAEIMILKKKLENYNEIINFLSLFNSHNLFELRLIYINPTICTCVRESVPKLTMKASINLNIKGLC